MEAIATQVAHEAIAELKDIATQGIVYGDSTQKLLSALRRVIRSAESSERVIAELSQECGEPKRTERERRA